MTGSLEDTIAEAAHVWMYGDNGTRYTRRETEAMADAIAEALRAASVVPAEPANPHPVDWDSGQLEDHRPYFTEADAATAVNGEDQ